MNDKPLNKVELMVKGMMLSHHSIFPTRWHVLSHILVSFGTGMEWAQQEDGKYAIVYERQLEDLTPRGKSLDRIPDFLDDYPDFSMDRVSSKVEAEFAQLYRDFVNRNIDTMCRSRFKTVYRDEIERCMPLNNRMSVYSPLVVVQEIQRELVDQDWADTIIEFAQHYCYRIRAHFTLTMKDPTPYLPEIEADNFKLAMSTLAHLEDPEKKARLAKIQKDVIDRLKEED